jgi:histidinol-phosphate aminotransferase
MSAVDSARGFLRPELAALAPYSLDLSPCRFKLDQNESPWELPRPVKERVAARLLAMPWGRYPDFHGDALRRALGEAHGWPWEGVLVGNGSNELLALASIALSRPGGEVLGVEPSFGLYRRMVLQTAARPRFLPPRSDLSLPISELIVEVERDPSRPLLLCSPNNPTGAAATPPQLEALLTALAAPLLLDNAYGELCRFDYRPLLHHHRNLVLFRTFSKVWALGGLRVGYLLADPDLVAELTKIKLPYNLGRAGALAAEEALRATRACERRIAALRGRRRQWARLLAHHGLEVFPSEANFLLVRCGAGEAGQSRAREILTGLARKGIRVRDVGEAPGLGGCLRFSVGDGRALRAVGTALEEMAAEEAGLAASAGGTA